MCGRVGGGSKDLITATRRLLLSLSVRSAVIGGAIWSNWMSGGLKGAGHNGVVLQGGARCAFIPVISSQT